MKSAYRWKLVLGLGLIALLAACAPKRKETQFAKNKEAEAGQTYTEDQLRAALGSDRYDALVMGIGAANLNLLSYGIGISNMTALINEVNSPAKLTSLMSDGPNSKKLTALDVLELLNKTDDICWNTNFIAGTSGSANTIKKIGGMIRNVTVAGMEGIKNILHGVKHQPLAEAGYTDRITRLAQLIAGLDERKSIQPMPTLVNELTAPPPLEVYSASGTAKLIRLVNNTIDIVDLIKIINDTQSLTNITGVMSGLTGNMYCYRISGSGRAAEFTDKNLCESAGATWVNTLCSNPIYNNRQDCVNMGATWTSDGIDNMSRIINELDKACSDPAKTSSMACYSATTGWYTKASKVPVIVNNITAVSNMFNIINGLSNDGRRPPWPTGLPVAYPGDAGNVFDGVDSMVATLNAINVPAMGDPVSANTMPFGLNGVKRLAYLVNNLEVAGTPENDSSFDDTTGGYDCTSGNFNNQVNWAFSDNNRTTGGPSWTTQGVVKQAGACALASDGTAASPPTISNPVDNRTQTAELIVNLTSDGSVAFQTNSADLGAGDVVRFFINDVCQNCGAVWTTQANWQTRSYPISSGLRRLRWDVHRAPGSIGRFYLDSVTLPGTKGAARTAAQKTAIMMNNLYINSSLTNVADLLNAVTTTTVPTASCWSNTPITCTASNNNGLDALAYVVNRAEYPGGAGGTGIISAVTMSGTTVTWNTHNLAIGTAIKFSTTGTLPSPLLPTDVYYVAAAPAPTANTFSVASAPGGSAITLTGGSGSHTAISLPRLAVTVNQIGSISEMKDILNSMGSVSSFQQLVSMMDFIRTPGNIPALINFLSTGGGAKTAQILSNISAAGTSNMLRILEDVSNGGAPIADVAALINGATTTGHVGNILTELSLSGNTSIAGTETYFASPTGGMKLAQFFNQVNTKAAAAPAQDCAAGPSPINSNFCVKNHIVRLVNDIAPPAVTNGATTIAQIVGGMRPDAGPGGNTGVVRMVNVLYDLKTMNATTYPNALSNATADTYGRLTALIADMGGVGGTNVARMVNELTDNTVTPANSYLLTRLAYIVKNVNRIRYLSRLMSELTNVDLMIALLNDPTTNMVRIDTLVDRQGDLTYGVSPTGDPSPKYGANPSGAGCNVAGCDVSTSDKLGRLIVLINQVTAITNVIKVVNQTYDLNFLSSSTDTFSYGAASKTDGSGFGFINAVTRITSLSNLMNGVTNIDLLINILNGDGSANMTTGVNFDIMIKTVNNVSGSQRKGAACKAGAARVSAEDPTTCTSRGGTWDTNFDKDIGDVSIISGIINDLGWDAGIPGPRTMAEQMRVVNVFNNVRYCGIMPQFDRDTTPGSPTTEYYPCQTDVSYNYNPASDIYDRRHRVSNVLLGMKSSQAMAIIVGEVTNTQKTIDVMNGSRRINTIIKTVDWLPGEATAALLNYTDAARINTGLVYLTNNLDPNEDIAAQAFVQMIHWGVDLPTAGCAAGARNCPCVSFRGIGPKRLAGVLNTEYGPYLETILTMFGWRNAIPALVCGFGTTQTTTDNCGFLYTGANRNVSANFTTSGTALDGSTCSGATPCQQIAGGIATVTFPRVETLAITQNPTPSGQGANGQTYTHTYSANVAANCQNFLPETSGALGLERATDDIVYRGMRGCMAGIAAATVPAGMTGIWQVLKGQGFVGWLLSNGGTMGTPPLQATANTPRCTDSGETDEWNCIKWGKNDNNGADNIGGNSDDNVSYNRWGNYCSIPGYSTPSTCEAANGRWMPNKNYATCQINPDIHGPR